MKWGMYACRFVQLLQCLYHLLKSCRHGGTIRCLSLLHKGKLIHHENVPYNGYRLTYLGYDFLAIKTLFKRGSICSVGPQIGVGKEADVFQVSFVTLRSKISLLHIICSGF